MVVVFDWLFTYLNTGNDDVIMTSLFKINSADTMDITEKMDKTEKTRCYKIFVFEKNVWQGYSC